MKPISAALLATLALLTACETMEGLGRDTEKAGAGLENAAERSDGNHSDDSTASGR